ncbi:MAG: heat shock protein HspQ [Brevundimonas sp.]|uniref:heat shock protein HspQ n=1 Tax=Brevundimonas sp. TaxID=1871086 RepID=UPI0039199CBF
MIIQRTARFGLGQIVRHRDQPLEGMVVDVDAVCAVSFDDPRADQPFYQVFAYGEEGGFIAYVPEDALMAERDGKLPSAAEQAQWFTTDRQGRYAPRSQPIH